MEIGVVERAVTAVAQQRSQSRHGIRIGILCSLQEVGEREQIGAYEGYPPAQQELAPAGERTTVRDSICRPAQPPGDGQAVAGAKEHLVL